MTDSEVVAHNQLSNGYSNGLRGWRKRFAKAAKKPDSKECKDMFYAPCRHEEWKDNDAPERPGSQSPDGIRPDHVHDAGLGGKTKLCDIGTEGLKWMNTKVNHELGQKMKKYNPPDEHGELVAHPDCQCS